MGFGILCVGYLCLLLFRVIPIEPIGFYLITLACDKLSAQNKAFRAPRNAAALLFFESIFGALLWIDNIVGIFPPTFSVELLTTVENAVYYVGLLIFHLLLYHATHAISSQVGYDGGKRNTRIGFATTCIFYIGELVAFVPALRPYLSLPLALFQLIWMFWNVVLLVGCYRMIVNDDMLEREEQKYQAFLDKYGKKRANDTKLFKNGKTTDKVLPAATNKSSRSNANKPTRFKATRK